MRHDAPLLFHSLAEFLKLGGGALLTIVVALIAADRAQKLEEQKARRNSLERFGIDFAEVSANALHLLRAHLHVHELLAAGENHEAEKFQSQPDIKSTYDWPKVATKLRTLASQAKLFHVPCSDDVSAFFELISKQWSWIRDWQENRVAEDPVLRGRMPMLRSDLEDEIQILTNKILFTLSGEMFPETFFSRYGSRRKGSKSVQPV